MELVRITEAAAIASAHWLGHGDNTRADEAAVEAMRRAMDEVAFNATIVIGEGERDEADVLAACEILGAVDPVLVFDPHLFRPRALFVVAEFQAPDDLAADAFEGRRREDALRCPAAAHDRVQVRARDRHLERGDDVAVLDEVDPRAGLADVLDQLLVTRSVEDDDREVVDLASQRLRDDLQVLLHRTVDVDLPFRRRPDDELLHVGIGRV